MSPEPITRTVGGRERSAPATGPGHVVQEAKIGRLTGIGGHPRAVRTAIGHPDAPETPQEPENREVTPPNGIQYSASGLFRDLPQRNNHRWSRGVPRSPSRTPVLSQQHPHLPFTPEAPVPLRASVPPGWTAWFGMRGRHVGITGRHHRITHTPTGVPAGTLTWVTSSATPGANEVDFCVALRGFNNNDDPTAADGHAVCGRPAGCANDDDGDNNSDQPTLKIELRADKLAAGTFRDPIERMDFYVRDVAGVSWRVGQDASGTAGRVGGDGTNARFRTWSYSVTLPGPVIAAATRAVPAGLGTEVSVIQAVTVNSSGGALLRQASLTFGAAPSN